MNAHDKVNILMGDDQPAKLLSYEVILRELGENLIPAYSTDKELQPPDGTPLNVEGHRLNRLALQRTQLAYHMIEKMRA